MSGPSRSVVLHAHFYQPPRENPWTGRVPRQPSAAPDRDWNVRVTRECYAPFTRARLDEGDEEGGALRELNLLEFVSFNFGPTLLSWMERESPDAYARVLDADAASLERIGHGNAIAQAYHHSILPLASARDKHTEVRWGLEDFQRRFGRASAGLWLPETAMDAETLDVVADHGVRFVFVAPHQVDPVPVGGMPGRYRTAGGVDLTLVPYDGVLAHEVAFGNAAADGESWAERLATVGWDGAGPEARGLVSLAMDGETFGHHHAFAEMGLAAAVTHLTASPSIRLENVPAFLERMPRLEDVDIVEPSSWSCAHGVDRWRLNCGCALDPGAGPDLSWRAPLRAGLEELAYAIHERFEREASRWLEDPWAARDAYGVFASEPVAPPPEVVAEELSVHVRGGAAALEPPHRTRLAQLLEMERNALRMFTSCAWFFDELSRLEPLQVLRYAERAIQLSGEPATLRAGLLRHLARAPVPDDRWTDGAHLYRERILGARRDGQPEEDR